VYRLPYREQLDTPHKKQIRVEAHMGGWLCEYAKQDLTFTFAFERRERSLTLSLILF